MEKIYILDSTKFTDSFNKEESKKSKKRSLKEFIEEESKIGKNWSLRKIFNGMKFVLIFIGIFALTIASGLAVIKGDIRPDNDLGDYNYRDLYDPQYSYQLGGFYRLFIPDYRFAIAQINYGMMIDTPNPRITRAIKYMFEFDVLNYRFYTTNLTILDELKISIWEPTICSTNDNDNIPTKT